MKKIKTNNYPISHETGHVELNLGILSTNRSPKFYSVVNSNRLPQALFTSFTGTLAIVILLLAAISLPIQAQSPVVSQRTNEKIEMRIPASEFNSETVFHMKNINGDLRVEGYNGDEILITGNKIVTGKPALLNDFAPDEIYLDKLSGESSLFVFVRHPGTEVEVWGDELHYTSNRKKNSTGRYKNELDFEFNLQLKIPHYLISEISTINGGEVVVEGMSKRIEASNVNGSVFVNDVKGAVKAQTVNGNIRVDYSVNPPHDADFHTVNGNIEVYAPENLSAVVTFRSLHGELYTDFDQIKYLPKRVNKKSDGMTRFSIEQTAPIQIGEGGPEMRFQLLNGNAYIRKIKL